MSCRGRAVALTGVGHSFGIAVSGKLGAVVHDANEDGRWHNSSCSRALGQIAAGRGSDGRARRLRRSRPTARRTLWDRMTGRRARRALGGSRRGALVVACYDAARRTDDRRQRRLRPKAAGVGPPRPVGARRDPAIRIAARHGCRRGDPRRRPRQRRTCHRRCVHCRGHRVKSRTLRMAHDRVNAVRHADLGLGRRVDAPRGWPSSEIGSRGHRAIQNPGPSSVNDRRRGTGPPTGEERGPRTLAQLDVA